MQLCCGDCMCPMRRAMVTGVNLVAVTWGLVGGVLCEMHCAIVICAAQVVWGESCIVVTWGLVGGVLSWSCRAVGIGRELVVRVVRKDWWVICGVSSSRIGNLPINRSPFGIKPKDLIQHVKAGNVGCGAFSHHKKESHT